MTKTEITKLLSLIGGRFSLDDIRNGKHWIQMSCPFAKWTHRNGVDIRPSASLQVKKDPIWFYCRACKQSFPLDDLAALLLERGLCVEKCEQIHKFVTGIDRLVFELDTVIEERPAFNKTPLSYMIPADSMVRSYLQLRGVPTSVIPKYDIRRDGKYMALPLYNGTKELVGIARRNMGDEGRWKTWPKSQPDKCMYGEQFLKGADDVLVVEGHVDVLYTDGLIDGLKPISANGSNLSDYHVMILKRCHSVTLMMDADEVGDKLGRTITKKIIGTVPLLFEAKLPRGEDPASIDKGELTSIFGKRSFIRRAK